MYTLEGNFRTKKVYLNGKLINPRIISRITEQSNNYFDWGVKNKGSFMLAAAILINLTGSYDGTTRFRDTYLSVLPRNSFKMVFELEEKQEYLITKRQFAICNAHGYNKFLSIDHLSEMTNEELYCNMHPLEREQFAFNTFKPTSI